MSAAGIQGYLLNILLGGTVAYIAVGPIIDVVNGSANSIANFQQGGLNSLTMLYYAFVAGVFMFLIANIYNLYIISKSEMDQVV